MRGPGSRPVSRLRNKAGRVFKAHISEDTVWNVVREYVLRLGQHDLRLDLRQTLPSLGWQARTDSASSRLPVHPDDGTQSINDHLPVEPELARSFPEREPPIRRERLRSESGIGRGSDARGPATMSGAKKSGEHNPRGPQPRPVLADSGKTHAKTVTAAAPGHARSADRRGLRRNRVDR